MTPAAPSSPWTPVGPAGPGAPEAPVWPDRPVAPVSPGPPVGPVDPSFPSDPLLPLILIPTPVGPVSPSGPVGPVFPVSPVSPSPSGPVGPVEPAKSLLLKIKFAVISSFFKNRRDARCKMHQRNTTNVNLIPLISFLIGFIRGSNHVIGNKMCVYISRVANVRSKMKQIWTIFTHLKLWVAVARQLQVGGNLNDLF